MTASATPMEKWKTRRVSRSSAIALLAAATLLLPELALADEDAAEAHFTDSSSDRAPAVTAFPKYPSIARRDRIEGEATVCFTIDARGKVVRPSVRSSTHKIFVKPAMKAIRNSSFTPLDEGQKLSVEKTCRTYRFRLDPVNARNAATPPPAGDTATVPAGEAPADAH